MLQGSIVDLVFPITTGVVPADHGYWLYAALARALPTVHGAPWLAIHPLSGMRVGEDSMALTSASRLVLRLPAEKIPSVLALAGSEICLGSAALRLGAPNVSALHPARKLFARRVAVRLTTPPVAFDGSLDLDAFRAGFESEALRQMRRLEVSGRLAILAPRRLRVKSQNILVYSVEVDHLSEQDSLRLQEHGLGGKRRMGCGVFRPSRREREG